MLLLLQINLLLKLLEKCLVVLKKSGATKVATDAFKTASKRATKKTAEANSDLIISQIKSYHISNHIPKYLKQVNNTYANREYKQNSKSKIYAT